MTLTLTFQGHTWKNAQNASERILRASRGHLRKILWWPWLWPFKVTPEKCSDRLRMLPRSAQRSFKQIFGMTLTLTFQGHTWKNAQNASERILRASRGHLRKILWWPWLWPFKVTPEKCSDRLTMLPRSAQRSFQQKNLMTLMLTFQGHT